MAGNPEQKEQIEKDAVFLIILSIIIIFVLIFVFRDQLGYIGKTVLYLDCYVGKLLNNLFGIYPESDRFLLYLKNSYNLEFDYKTFQYYSTVNTNAGEQIFSISRMLDYYKFLNIFFMFIFVLLFVPPLKKMKSLISKAILGLEIKNKQISLYFNDKILQKIKRKVIKGQKGDQLANADYFPAHFPDDKELYHNFITNSIEYSKHPLNFDKERYNDLAKVWKSMLLPYAKQNKKIEMKNGKTKTEISVGYYALMRWSYINKDLISTEPKERMIFINSKNVKYSNLPYSNLFTSKNSNKYIIQYMEKYHKELFKGKKRDEEIDFTETLIDEELPIFFEIKYFKNSKTFFNTVKKGQNIDTPLIYTNILSDEEIMEKVEDEINSNPSFSKKSDSEKEILMKKLFKKEKLALMEANKTYNSAATKYFKNLKYLLTGESSDLRFMQPIVPRTYILHPIGNKSISEFETPGIKIITDILQKYIVNQYKEVIENQVKQLKEDIEKKQKELRKIKNSELATTIGQEIEANEAIISDLLSSLDVNNEQSRIKKLKELKDIHKFEETYVISLWEYGMNLANLPTGRLSLIKRDNVVLWYALTSLGRPFTFNAAMPIEVMRQQEIELFERRKNVAIIYEDSSIETIRDIFDEDFYKKIKEESL